MQKITPFLWFDRQAEEAAEYYTSIFKQSKIGSVTHYNKESAAAAGLPEGTVMTVQFQLDGQDFVALNGGPQFEFSEAVSFVVSCKTQEEIDEFWRKLSDGGSEGQCGWLKDKFGLSWQVVPSDLGEILQDKDPARAKEAMAALMKMGKIDVNLLRRIHTQPRSEKRPKQIQPG